MADVDGHVPKYFLIPPVERFPLRSFLHIYARNKFLRNYRQMLGEFSANFICEIITEMSFKNYNGLALTYQSYKYLKSEFGMIGRVFFTNALYARLYQGATDGSISSALLIAYIKRKLYYEETRVNLTMFDSSGQSYLTEDELELYFSECVAEFPFLSPTRGEMTPFYACHATQYIIFFLDPNKTGKIKIVDIMCSQFPKLFYDLKVAHDENKPPVSEDNWFSPLVSHSVYLRYLKMDVDSNGMLAHNELKKFCSRKFTSAFVSRFQETHIMFQGECDFKGFLWLFLAYEHMTSIQSQRYFFSILDTNDDGYICEWDINYFFKDMLNYIDDELNKVPIFEYFCMEIFDIVLQKKASHRRFSLTDLINFPKGDVIIKLMIDVECFLSFDAHGLCPPA